MAERVYKMTRLGPGDYLLPANDAQTLWRLRTYTEEGTLIRTYEDGTEESVVGEFWSIWRWKGGAFPSAEELVLALEDEHDGYFGAEVWEFWAGPFRTRAEALETVLR